jgi:hypothetical protein
MTSRRWPRGAPGSLHAGACLLEIEDKGDFSKKTLDFRVFSRILKIEQVLYCLVIKTSF